MTPTVSLILPVHNEAHAAAATIASVLQQTLADLELIVVDDGSTDPLAVVLQNFFGDSRLQLLQQPRASLPRALNRALAQVRGEYVTWLAAGDMLLPACLAGLHSWLSARSQCSAVCADYFLVDEFGNPLTAINAAARALPVKTKQAVGWSSRFPPGWGPCLLLRRQAIEQTGTFSETLGRGALTDYVARLDQTGDCCHLPRILYLHRRAESFC